MLSTVWRAIISSKEKKIESDTWNTETLKWLSIQSINERSNICSFKRWKTFFAFPNVNKHDCDFWQYYIHSGRLRTSVTEFRHYTTVSLCEWNEKQFCLFMIAQKTVYASAIKFYLVSHSAKFDPFSGSHFEWHSYISHDSRQRMRIRNKH